MQSERTARLAQAVAAMPAGPSRERFQTVLAEVTAAEERDGARDDERADGELGQELGEQLEGEPADGTGEPDESGAEESAVEVPPSVESRLVPLVDAAPAAPATEQRSKRRWRRSG